MSGWWGGQGGCERRIKVFVKIQKKKFGGGGVRSEEGRGGVRVDEIEELKFLGKFTKKNFGGGGGGVGSGPGGGGGVGLGGVRLVGGGGGVRVDVNEELKFL